MKMNFNTAIFDRSIQVLPVLYIPLLILILPQIISSGYLFRGDVSFDFAPLTYTGVLQWKAGHFPLWTPLIQCGFPLLGEGMGALFYPTIIFLSKIVPAAAVFFVDIGLHLLVAPIIMYRYCRSIGLGRVSSVLGSWVWILAGPFAGYLGSPAIHGITWFPLFFMMIDRMFKNGKMSSAVAVYAFFSGLSWLGGLPQIPVYATMAAGMYLVFRLWQHKPEPKNAFLIVAGWVAAVALGVALGGVQLLPTLEAGSESIRAGGIDYTFATYGSLFPAGFMGFFFPLWTNLAGYWLAGPNVFAGFTVLTLVILTFPKKDGNKVVLFFWLLLLCGCFLSLGKFNPLYRFMYNLPALHFLRCPSRFMLFAQFAISVLAATGLDLFMSGKKANSIASLKKDAPWKALVAAAIPVACMVAGNLLLAIAQKPLFAYAHRYVERAVSGNAYALQEASFYYQRIVTMFNDVAAVLNPLKYAWIISIVAGIAGVAIIWLWSRGRLRLNVQRALLITCLMAMTQFVANPITALREKRSAGSPLVRHLEGQDGLFRIYNVNYPENVRKGTMSEERLDPDFNMFHGIENVAVYSSLGSLRYYRFMGRLSTVNLAFGVTSVNDTIVKSDKRILDFLNVKYCTADMDVAVEGLKNVAIGGTSKLYENTSVLPRALVVPECRVIPDTATMLRLLHSPAFEPVSTVFLEEQPELLPEKGQASVPVINKYENDKVEIDAMGPGWLVVSDLYYPGWRASVDQLPVKIFRANYAFRAVALRPGSNHVIFSYEPDSFIKGAMLSIIGFICIGGLAGAGRMRHCLFRKCIDSKQYTPI